MMVGFPLGLLAIGVTLGLLVLALTGMGLAVRRAFGLQRLRLDDCFLAFWVGYAIAILFLILWNFAFAVGLAALVVVLATGGFGMAWTANALTKVFDQESWRPSLWEILLLTLGGLWVVNHCMADFESWDGVLYHVQAVEWAKTYPVVPGIANLHGPLAFNNSSFLFDAMLDSGWWEGRAFHIAGGVLVLVAVLQAIVSGLQWLRRENPTGLRLYGFLMLPVMLNMVQVASYSTDQPMTLVLLAATWVLYAALDASASNSSATEDAYRVFALAMLLAAAVSIKLTAGVFAVVALPVGIVAWWRRRAPKPKPGLTQALVWTSVGLAIFAGAWIARGVVMSGYPFFPLSIAGLPVDWRAPAEHANSEAAYTLHTARAFEWSMISGNWMRQILRDIYAVLIPSCLAAGALWVRWRWRGQLEGAQAGGRETWWLVLPALLAIGVWFVTAPSHRYAPAFFWPLAAVCVCEAQRTLSPQLTARGRRWVSVLLVAVAISPLFVKPSQAAIREGRNLTQTFVEHNVIVPASDLWLAPLGGHVDVTTFTTRSGAVVHVPLKRVRPGLPNACWAAPIPCTPTPAPNLELREPGRLDKGFRVDGGWEMLDWPFYWRSYFLPEWRTRSGSGG